MSEAAEAKLAELRKTHMELKAAVIQLDHTRDPNQCRIISERITQTLVAVDGVEASKTAAVEAFRERDRKSSMAIAVLVTRRRTLVKDLHALGDLVDEISATIGAVSDQNTLNPESVIVESTVDEGKP